MDIIIYIYSNLIFFSPLFFGFFFVLRTGRLFLGIIITWILFDVVPISVEGSMATPVQHIKQLCLS
jgi:hypothetical protein